MRLPGLNPPPPTDEQTMWLVQTQDDPVAFATLVNRWQTPIQHLCSRMTGNIQTAEDLTQETFARIYTHRKAYQPSAKFSTFLWRVAINLCYDHLRKQSRQPWTAPTNPPDDTSAHSADCLPTPDAQPDQQLLRTDDHAAVRTALAGLPSIYRSVLILRHYQDLRFSEIAEILGIPEGTVKSRMAEGLRHLRSRITKTSYHHASQNQTLLSPQLPCP